MNNEYKDESVQNEEKDQQSDYAYMNVIRGKENSRHLSIASLLLAVVSLICSFTVPFLGIIAGGGAFITGAISRKNIGYFDKATLFGIFAAIFSTLFSVTVIIIRSLFI